jgi:IclR family transcriptional regulator, acetate operon repressor
MIETPTVNRNAMAPSTDGCLAILELLSRHPEGLTLTDICRDLGLTKNMAFRILNDMAARDYVLRSDEEKRYLLGSKLLQMSVPRAGNRNLVDEAAPEIRALRDECDESVGLLVPNGGEAVLVYFQPSRQPIRTIYDVGVRIPLYSNAPGKVFLAFGDEKERRQRLQLQSLRRFNARTITDPRKLEAQLSEARAAGYTVDRAEEIKGCHCVAAPVYDNEDRVIAAVVITGPSERIPESKFNSLGHMVAAAADRIAARLRK